MLIVSMGVIGAGLAIALSYSIAHVEVIEKPYPVYSTNETVRIEYVDRPVITEKIVTVNVTLEKITILEKIVKEPIYINGEWREFESLGVLTEWAEKHLADIWMVGSKMADCDDYAERLQTEAYKDGYLLSSQLVTGGMLNGKNVSNFTEVHMGNLAMVGNAIYFIEPQPEYFRVIFVCNRD